MKYNVYKYKKIILKSLCKKICFSFFILYAALSANAQLTQANQAPVPSYSYAMFHCDSVNTDPGFSGGNVLWDYSAIETYTDLVTNYTTAVATNSAYPNATVVVGSSQGTELYYSSTSSDLSLYGGNLSFGGIAATLVYDNPATAAVYPMVLNTSTSSLISGSISISGAQLPLTGTFTGNTDVIADGSGTLVLPGVNATFTNTLRVVSNQTLYVDMAGTIPVFGTVAATGTITLQNYDFYSIGTRHPLFSLQNTNADIYANGQPISFSQTVVLRDKNVGSTPTQTYLAVQNISSDVMDLNVYPNPTSSYINFSANNPKAYTVIIFDLRGKVLREFNFTDKKVKVDISEMCNGLYLYSILSSDGNTLKTGKITISH